MKIEITSEYLDSQGLSPTFQERFWSKVNKNGPIQPHKPELGPCWEWVGCKAPNGRYGIIGMRWSHHKRKGMILSHRASWILAFGTIPPEKEVCHHCDFGFCVRPDHLWLGTHVENMTDMVSKGRGRGLCGENHNMSKLTWDQVRQIRLRYSKPARNGAKLAREFGVTCGHIHDIVHFVVWNE